jgi:hypothetical protein
MPFPTTSNALLGETEITITYQGQSPVTIPSNFVGSWTPSFSPQVLESSRLSGTTSRPSGRLDNPTAQATVYLNSFEDIKYFIPDAMDGNAAVFGSTGVCYVPEAAEVRFHNPCETNDNNDIVLPVAYIAMEDTNERNATDEVAVMFNFYPQPNAEGQVRYGGDGS